jgi:hypothetical protein
MSLTTIRVDELPPDAILLTDIFPFETLSDKGLKKATFQDLVDFININSNALQFEVKTLLVNQSYINDNFETNGIGKNLCLGWRIADELSGLVTIGQGVGYPVGSYGGEEKHTLTIPELPSHDHDIPKATSDADGLAFSPGTNASGFIKTVAKGGGQAHNNMQPYLVALKIVKL